ncbi:iron uptake porin [Pantanalinema rosaneae CENA516]|uniref:iron uptake porin n=1 Tax=Pantanalinema rosaneae TaxID=1620701 RepID=UPI003D6EC4BB
MTKNRWRTLALSLTAILTSIVLVIATTASMTLAQITSVAQFSDVRPTDYYFQSLQKLVESYGCLVGYPDTTFRANRTITRGELAANLSSCLDRVNELFAASTAESVKREDLQMSIVPLQQQVESLRQTVESLRSGSASPSTQNMPINEQI